MKNDTYLKMNIDELKRKESDLVNYLKFSDEHLMLLFKEQLALAQKLVDEKKVNDDLRDQITEIRISIEVKEHFK